MMTRLRFRFSRSSGGRAGGAAEGATGGMDEATGSSRDPGSAGLEVLLRGLIAPAGA